MSENTQNLVSNQDILQAIQSMDHRLGGLDHKFEGLDSKFNGLDGRLASLDQKLTSHIEESKKTHEDILSAINTSFTEIEDKMVTKDDLKQELAVTEARLVTKVYLDDKLSDLKGNLVELVRKEDHKVDTVVSILHGHQVLSGNDLEQIDQVRLFPKTTTA